MTTYETYVMLNSDNDVVSEEHETPGDVINEMLERHYTLTEMRENGFTLNKILSDGTCWLECLDELEY